MNVFHFRFSLVASVKVSRELLMQTCWWPLSDHWSVQITSPHLSGCVFYGCLESLTGLSALWGPINNIPALVQIMAWRRPGDKPLSEPMLIFVPTHICVTRPQGVKLIRAGWRVPWCTRVSVVMITHGTILMIDIYIYICSLLSFVDIKYHKFINIPFNISSLTEVTIT